jgi:cyclopropane fatty-acyl-phospholipid synthase-like methyltransferase
MRGLLKKISKLLCTKVVCFASPPISTIGANKKTKYYKNMNDYSEYLKQPGMIDMIEKSWTTECKEIHDSYAKAVNDTLSKFKLKSVIEIGCGTGEVAKRLKLKKVNDYIPYAGIDTNEECLMLARKKNPSADMNFWKEDIRTFDAPRHDIVCAFSILKHFGLHEWNEIFAKVCSLGDFLIFNMPMLQQEGFDRKDDGTEFHHVWISYDVLYANLAMNGFTIVEARNDNSLEPIFICKRIEL